MPKRITSRDVACPTCGAGQGEKCRGSAYSGRSNRTVDYHHARREAARRYAAQVGAEPAVVDPVQALRLKERTSDRMRSVHPVTEEAALRELRYWRRLYPSVPPEVPAWGLLRYVDGWHEVDAIQRAMRTLLREDELAAAHAVGEE